MAEEFRLSLGAHYLGNGTSFFRVWAPRRGQVEVALEGSGTVHFLALQRDSQGYFSGVHPAEAGMRYRFRLDGGDCFPDPCARFLPEGPHGPSEIVDPARFSWSDRSWRGVSPKGKILYEVHVGCYTQEGTYRALWSQLPVLKQLGVTVLELMPVHTFPGRFNWGYDGVGMFAPCAVYGTPDELRELVDRAHQLELGVILDVVYNHLGPDGNYLSQYAAAYFSNKNTDWGPSLNFDGDDAGPVRDFFIQNACYWISEYHFDGLRLDASHSIHDQSTRHIVAEISEKARAAGEGRKLLLVAEDERQEVRSLLPATEGGFGLDAMWIDDLHHTVRVAVTGRAEGYYSDYQGSAQELLSCARYNALYQGQWFSWQKKPRGTALWPVPPEQVVLFLQNHDQVAHQLVGRRLHQLGGEPLARALTTYLLLLPQTPLLFMGQEFFASSPFSYFTDHSPELQAKVEKGREEFLAQFPSIDDAIRREGRHPPRGEEAFRQSKLKLEEREKHGPIIELHRELLRLRREDPVFSGQARTRIEGETLSEAALVLRLIGSSRTGDRLVVLNLKRALVLQHAPYPMLSAMGRRWKPLLSSEEARFGGEGPALPTGEGPWQLPAQCAFALSSED